MNDKTFEEILEELDDEKVNPFDLDMDLEVLYNEKTGPDYYEFWPALDDEEGED